MPQYDFRCNDCGTDQTFFYKRYADYDNATPTCENCGSTNLTRVITSVNIAKPKSDHKFSNMSADQMLGVLESGDSAAVGEMMKQVGDGVPKSSLGEDYVNAAEALSRGVSPDQVERDLSAGALGKPSSEPLPDPKKPKKSDSAS